MSANLPGDPLWVRRPPIEVLIVDDSAVVRQRLKGIIEADPAFRVSLAADPYEAVALLRRSVPGVIVLDVEMPRMDGLTFLKKLMGQHPLPVVLCTSIADRALHALELGAIEVIAKPDWRSSEALDAWSINFMDSLRNAARAGVPKSGEDRFDQPESRLPADAILPRQAYRPRPGEFEPIVSIGVSTGGVQAIPVLLRGFAPGCPGIVIVQHMPPEFTRAFADRLNNDPAIAIEVAEATPNETIRPGRALVIPGDLHGLVRRSGVGYRVELVEGEKVCRHRPSVEVLFRSTAQAAGQHAAGVILTGMGDDGAGGLLEMREAGAFTIAQDEATCTVFGMPREAIRRGAVQVVRPLPLIAATVMAWALGPDNSSRH